MYSAIVDFTTAKFAFYKCVTTIRKVQNNVGFQSIPITIVGYVTIEVGSICFKISDTHLFKNESKSLKLYLQRLCTLS